MWLWGLAAAFGTEGTVTAPLSDWEALTPQTTRAGAASALPVSRWVDGALNRGLFTGTVRSRFEVIGTTSASWPIVSAATTVAGATLDGRPVSLAVDDSGTFWTVPATPGLHEVTVSVLHGAETVRFTRALAMALPPGGSTAFNVVLPEADVFPVIQNGVWTSVSAAGPNSTRVGGWVDASGRLDLAWERRSDAPLDPSDAELDAEVFAVLTLGERLVRGTTKVTARVRAGAIDRLQLEAPPEVEVLGVTGDQVLQWHSVSATDSASTDRIEVLLREVEDSQVEATITYQYPAPDTERVPLRTPLPSGNVPTTGAVGLVAPVGLRVDDDALVGKLDPQDIPRPVLELTGDPLRTAVLLKDGQSMGTVALARQPDVVVSTSRIDDIQAIVVAMEDGTEVGKARLVVRNTSRQLLTVDLPEGARLTHCFRDGLPLSPGAVPGQSERVLVPLTRSDRVHGATTTHVVAPGDTLSGLALRYYGDSSLWPFIDEANANSLSGGLHVGRPVVVPERGQHEEEAFVLELGWERRVRPFGPFGARVIGLPRLDLDVMAANWHLYLPERIVPVTVQGLGALTSVDYHRADPASRLIDMLVLDGVPSSVAYAGMDSEYKSFLSTRRSVYREQVEAVRGTPGSDAFPLVGVRNRLRGVLLGTEPAAARVFWVTEAVASGTRWLAFAVAMTCVVLGMRVLTGRTAAVVAVAGATAMVTVGHFVLGVNKATLLGVDAGLLLALLWRFAELGFGWRTAVARPRWRLIAFATSGLVLVCGWPALLPLWAFLLLAALHWRLQVGRAA